MFEAWKEARRIVEDHKDFFRIRDEVETARQRWQYQNRTPALLLPKGVPLAEGEKIVARYGDELTDDQRAFVSASSRRARQNQRILTGVAAGLAVLVVMATAAGIFAYTAKKEAETNYDAAKATVDNLITKIAEGLGDLEGLRVKTINAVLGIVEGTIDRLQSASHGDHDLDRLRATELYLFAKDFQKAKESAQARKRADESLRIRTSLANYEHLKVSRGRLASVEGQLRFELSQSIELIGDLNREDGLVVRARERFKEALEIRRDLVMQSPNNNEWTTGISQAYVRIGDLDVMTDLAAAQQDYENALVEAAKTFRRVPDETQSQRELSWDFNKVGDVHQKRAEKTEENGAANAELMVALEAFDSSLCIRRRLDGREENNTRLKSDIAYTLDRLGRANLSLGNRLAAADDFFESLAIRQQLSKGDPDDVRYLVDIALNLERIGDAVSFERTSDVLQEGDVPEPEWATDELTSIVSNRLATASAFYEAGMDAWLHLPSKKADDITVRRDRARLQEKAREIRTRFDNKNNPETLGRSWWIDQIRAAQDAFDTRRQRNMADASTCWAQVKKAVDVIDATYHQQSVR